jgi:hypothetical protein
MGAGVKSPRHRMLGDVCMGWVSPSVSAGASSVRLGWGARRRCLIYPGVGRLKGKIPAMLLVGRLVNGPGPRDIRINVIVVRPPETQVKLLVGR